MAFGNDYLVRVILEAKAEGLRAFEEVKLAMRDLEAEAMATNAQLSVLRDHTRDTSLHMRQMSEDVRELAISQRVTEERTRGLMGELRNISAHTRTAADETRNLADKLENGLVPSLDHVNRSGGNAHSTLYRFVQGMIPGQQTAGNITIAIAALAAVFAPLTFQLAASLFLFGAWIVGATAFAATIALVLGGVALLVGGIIALGASQMGGLDPAAQLEKANKSLATAMERTEAAQEAVRLAQLRYDAKPTAVNLQILKDATEQLAETQQKQVDAQNAVNTATTNAATPFSVLHEQIAAVGKELGLRAVPMVNAMASAMIPLVPLVEKAGLAIMDWFGPRLPQVLAISQQAFGNLLTGIERLAKGWGELFDKVLARSPEFGNIINGAFNRVIDAALGLMDNLFRLSDWFIQRLPVLGANANSVFANIGLWIQGLGRVLGIMVDWVISHWPAITATWDATWKAIQDGWSAVSPILNQFMNVLKDLSPIFDLISQHGENLKIIYWALGAAIALTVVALESLFVIAVIVAGALVGLTEAAKLVGQTVGGAANAVSSAWENAKNGLGTAIDAIIGKQKGVGTTADDSKKKVGDAAASVATDSAQATSDAETAATRISTATGSITTGMGDSATATHTAAESIVKDEGNIAAGAENAGTRTHKATGDMGNDWWKLHLDLANTLNINSTTVAQWGINHQGVLSNVGHAWSEGKRIVTETLQDQIRAIHEFYQEHFKTSTEINTATKDQGTMWTRLSQTVETETGKMAKSILDYRQKHFEWGKDIQTSNGQTGGAFDLLGTVVAISTKYMGERISFFGLGARAEFTVLGNFMHDVVGPAFSALGTGIQAVLSVLGTAIHSFVAEGGRQFSALGNAANNMQRDIGRFFSMIGTAADALAQGVDRAFSGLGGSVHTGLHNVSRAIDDFGGKVNTALHPFGLPTIQATGYAEGGVIPGYAPGQDTVLAMLSPGEGILTPDAVRGLGGTAGIKALNEIAPGLQEISLGAQMGGPVNVMPGSWGGQCVVFAENLLGVYWPVQAAAQLARYVNSQTAKPGEAAVFTGGAFGHVAVVTGPGDGFSFPVIDSNWVGNEIIGYHTMNKSMYGFSGFIDLGRTLGTMAGMGIPGITSPVSLLNGLVDKAVGALGGWEASLAKGILSQTATGIAHKLGFDQGGDLPTGLTMAWNGTGRSETVTPAATMDKIEDLLEQAVSELRKMNGSSGLNASTAAGRFAGGAA